MAENPISVSLPADLPEDWVENQIVAPEGQSVGLDQQHGYNYLMEQVNNAQTAARQLGEAFSNLTAADVGAAPIQMFQSGGDKTIYVSKTGNDDTADGSIEKPFLTITAAINSLGKYITGHFIIIISVGTYDEQLNFLDIGGPGLLEVNGTSDFGVHVRAIYGSRCNCMIRFNSLDVFGETTGNYFSAMDFESCRYVFLNYITCTGEQSEDYRIGAVTAAHGTTLFAWNTTISNKQLALDCMGSFAFLTDDDTGENNTVGIRCGSGWGSFGGIVFKGGATIAGSEQTAFSGQIFD